MSESTTAGLAIRRRVALATAALFAALALPAIAPARAEAFFCVGSADRGSTGENSVEYRFVCQDIPGGAIQSFKVDPDKRLGPNTPANTEPPAPGEGWPLCERRSLPDPSDWFSCQGRASNGKTVRGGFGTQEPPCPLTTTVTVGTGLRDPATGEPTGTTFTFNLQGNLCTRSTPGLREGASCVAQGEQGLCRELVHCYTAGALFLEQSGAVEKLRRCVQVDTRYRLHSHSDGYHTHKRRKRIRARRSPFFSLYRIAQGKPS